MYDGYVFFCNKTSLQQCLSDKRYTCADEKTKPTEDQIKVGSIIFLQNAPEELPFLKDLKTCKLTSLETQNALDQLKKGELYINAKDQKNSI